MSKNMDIGDTLILALPEEAKRMLVVLCHATMTVWEAMPTDMQEEYGTPQAFMGQQIMLATKTILENEED